MRIILASQSPRRKEILREMGIDFECIPSNFSENNPDNLFGSDLVMYLAKNKALEVFNKNKDALVIGSDTIVCIDDEVLGKPIDREDCYRMLKKLSGRKHSVITGVALLSKDIIDVFYDEAFVEFKELSDEDIYSYMDTLEPFDKAGGYAIQGIGSRLVNKYDGDFYTIVGLPKEKVSNHIKKILK